MAEKQTHPDLETEIELHPWIFAFVIVVLGWAALYGMEAYADHLVHTFT